MVQASRTDIEILKVMVHRIGVRPVVNLLADAIRDLSTSETVYFRESEPLNHNDIEIIVANLKEDLF